MQKSVVFYVVFMALLLALGAAAAVWLFPLGLPFLALAVWWSLYFFSIRYTRESDRLVIRSGVLLKSEKIIPLSNILWRTSVQFPFSDSSALTILHTCGGNRVIFGGFSTDC